MFTQGGVSITLILSGDHPRQRNRDAREQRQEIVDMPHQHPVYRPAPEDMYVLGISDVLRLD